MITRKSRYEISLMRTAGSIVAETLSELKTAIKPGVSTAELDEIAYRIIINNHAIPTFKGYHGFPASICSSVNEQVVHGIPSKDVILNEGDIVSLDVGATFKGMVGDSAITVPVGTVEPIVQKLLEATEQALYESLKKAQVNNHLVEVSEIIEDKAAESGFGLVRNYGGHGVGHSMHEEPFVFNYRTANPGPVLKHGMTIAIEPMFNLGTDDVHTLMDGWTVVTDDGKPSAHFEHTVLVSDDGPVILTLAN